MIQHSVPAINICMYSKVLQCSLEIVTLSPTNLPCRELGRGGDTCVSERDLDLLTLHESPQMITGEKDKTTKELLSEAYGCLPQIQSEMIAAVKRSCLTNKALQRSRLDQ